jgi:periplasmic divalent cation tolerance protein
MEDGQRVLNEEVQPIMETNEHVVLFSTTGSLEEASRIADHLVSNHIVACVNIVPSIHSIYWWDNKVQQDQEVLMILKTRKSKLEELEKAIRTLHTYQTPELIAWNLDYGIREYVDWIDNAIE